MKYLILLFTFLSSTIFATQSIDRGEILKLIPSEFSNFKKTDTFEDLKVRFKDKIIETKDQKTLFLKHFRKDNDVTIGFENGKFSYVIVKLPKKERPSFFKQVFDTISVEERRKILRDNTNSGHEVGRSISVNLEDQSLRLKFNNDETKTLQTVILWNEGAKAP